MNQSMRNANEEYPAATQVSRFLAKAMEASANSMLLSSLPFNRVDFELSAPPSPPAGR